LVAPSAKPLIAVDAAYPPVFASYLAYFTVEFYELSIF